MTTPQIVVTGYSDDLIEVEGVLREEFPYQDTDGDEGDLVAFSDGTVLRIRYTNEGADGIWRITPVALGTAALDLDQCPATDPDRYSDRMALTFPADDPPRWVVHGIGVELATSPHQGPSR